MACAQGKVSLTLLVTHVSEQPGNFPARTLGQQRWPWGPRSHRHSPPALVRLLDVPAAGVAVGAVLREEAPGSVGHIAGAPGAASCLAGLLRSAGLWVAVDALLHRHGAGALRILL